MSNELFNIVNTIDKYIGKNKMTCYKFNYPCEYKRCEVAKSIDIVDEYKTLKETVENLSFQSSDLAYSYVEVRNRR
ncbi:MAG: hypothetical protein WCK67_04605 [bacterium]